MNKSQLRVCVHQSIRGRKCVNCLCLTHFFRPQPYQVYVGMPRQCRLELRLRLAKFLINRGKGFSQISDSTAMVGIDRLIQHAQELSVARIRATQHRLVPNLIESRATRSVRQHHFI